jgi:phage gp36-like protein
MGDFIRETQLNIPDPLKAYLSGETNSAEPNRNVLHLAIEYAEGVVKSRLGVSHTLPLDEALTETDLAFVRSLAEDIVLWRLYKNDPKSIITEDTQLGYDEALKHLDKVASRVIGIGLDDADVTDEKRSPISPFLRG